MGENSWWLEQIADFIYLLRKNDEAKSILQRRFKKDNSALHQLFLIIEKIDKLGYKDGVEFAFAHHYMDTVTGNRALGLIEIRVKNTLWRVIAYWEQEMQLLVMLDAFEAHKHKGMNEMVKQVLPRLTTAKELLEEVESDGNEHDSE